MSKTQTTYSFDIATQTKNGKWDRLRLKEEIENSKQIQTKLETLVERDGYIDATFYDALLVGEQNYLTYLVSVHTGDPLPTDTVQLYKQQADYVPQFALSPRIGSEIVIGTHNFADKTTWFGDSVRIEDQPMSAKDGYDGYVWKCDGYTNWIDMVTGRIHNQEKWSGEVSHGYTVKITVDGYEKTVCPPFIFDSSGGDYWIDYDRGEVHFFESLTGSTITASFSYATGSSFCMKPYAGKTLRIEDAEADFSQDCVLNTKFGYIVVGYVDVFAPQYMRGSNEVGVALSITTLDPPSSPSNGDTYIVGGVGTGAWTGYDGAIVQWNGSIWVPTVPVAEDWLTVIDQGMYFTFRNSTWNPTPYPPKTQIPIQEDFYSRVSQIITEARGALPPVNAIGASEEQKQLTDIRDFRRLSRGMKSSVQAIPFNYATTRELISSYGMELWVTTENNVVVEGEMLTITFYCSSIDEEI